MTLDNYHSYSTRLVHQTSTPFHFSSIPARSYLEMAPATGLSNSNHTATIIVGRPEPSDGKSHTIRCYLAGVPDDFGPSDGEIHATSFEELESMTASAFGGKQTLHNLSGTQKSRSFAYTTGNSLGGALRSGSYREGESKSLRRSD